MSVANYTINDKGYLCDEKGEMVTLYHGTSRKFTEHSSANHRTVLNEQYTGNWHCYSADKDTAWEYAKSARNQTIDKNLFLSELKEILIKNSSNDSEVKSAAFLMKIVKGVIADGYDKGWDILESLDNGSEDDYTNRQAFFKDITAISDKLGFNENDICDLTMHVEGSKYHDNDDLDDVMNILNARVNEIGHWVFENMEKMGFDQAIPEYRVLHSHIKCSNILVAKTRNQVLNASKDYDLIIDTSSNNKVNGEPEFLIRHGKQIKPYAYDCKVREAVEMDYETVTYESIQHKQITTNKKEVSLEL